MKLAWEPWDNTNALTATGESDTYLIVRDQTGVLLTRWYPSANLGAAILQIALTTIRIQAQAQADVDAAIARLRRMAQEYESGVDVTGQPAWQHNYRWVQPVE